jgi:hypothetical protein
MLDFVQDKILAAARPKELAGGLGIPRLAALARPQRLAARRT